ncbi:FtsX-like permease family protein [Streptomyces sp. BH106]|uniref:ABC transporter permease n=1 Tax=Streptomyces sp. BH106 TaxID=3410409 RepID=UPI003CFAC777
MITSWVRGLARRRAGRLIAAAAGIALAVALIASLGSFLTASKATMTQRAVRSVTVDWQVAVQPGASPGGVLSTVAKEPGTRTALPVGYAHTSQFTATSKGSTQTTGPGMALGVPDSYRHTFPGSLRTLSGADHGVLLAQQTAANLHVAPGDPITVRLPGTGAHRVRVDGVVDLPQADSLFQTVGAPSQSQPAAPPDNVVLLPAARFTSLTHGASGVTTQIHTARDTNRLPTDPAAAYTAVTRAAHHLEAASSGGALVGDNVGAALDAARQDAAYAQMMFLFLGLPGAVLAAALTWAVASAGGQRRRQEQALLRLRGLTSRRITLLAAQEAVLIGVGGAALGLATAALIGRFSFGSASFGGTAAWAAWYAVAAVIGLLVALASVLIPAVRDLRLVTIADSRREQHPARNDRAPWWMRYGIDVIVLVISLLVFRASSSNQYALVLAPEGVPALSVSYWAFLGPALLWIGSALLLWRIVLTTLTHGRGLVRRLARPFTGTLAGTTSAVLARRRRPLARSIVLLALAISFAISTAVFNSTYRQQAEVDARLTNGADVTVTEPPAARTTPSDGAALSANGVHHVEPLQHRYAYVGSDLQDLYGVRPGTIAKATSLQDAYFSGGTADHLMHTLATRPDNLLVSLETVQDFQLSPGDTVNLRVQDARTKALRTVPFHYAGIVKEFPTAPKDSFFVANASYIAKATGSDAVGAFLLDTGGSHQHRIAHTLRTRLGTKATVTDLTQTRGTIGTSLTAVDLAGLTRIELFFAVALSVGAGALVLALGLAERRRTFAIAGVLGATSRQLRGMVTTEAVLLASAGLAGGALIGWLLSQMLVKVLTGVFDPPPAHLAAPVLYLTGCAGAVLVAMACAAWNGIRPTRRPAVEELRDL